jgi:PAS domain S-box-containing protein
MATATQFPKSAMSAGTELRLLFENAPMGMAQCDRQGTILAVNPALTAMLSGSLQAIEPLRFTEVVAGQNPSCNLGMFRQLMNGERSSFQIETLLSRSPGADAWLRWTAWGVCGSAHNPDCVLLLAEDITESRNEKERAAQAERLQALGRMAGSIAHDFNNLLTGILLYCDLMIGELATAEVLVDASPSIMARQGDRLKKYAEEIRSAGIQATGVVQQLLNITRPRNLVPHPISLNATAEEMQNLLLRLVGENIELSFHLDPSLGLIKMDPAQAQQVLLNLVLNARDAMPAGGRIQVETGNCSVRILRESSGSEPDDSESENRIAGNGSSAAIPCVLFVVTDNGGGMSEETRRQAFQPYFTTKEQGRGTGLGLATVHNIVAGCGGLVQVESAPGRGTQVMVLVPSVSSSPESHAAKNLSHVA